MIRRRVPVLAFAPVLALLALLAWAFASPVGAGPDDDYHLVSSWCAGPTAGTSCAPATGAAAGTGMHRVPTQLIDISCFARHAERSAACQSQLFTGKSTDHLALTSRGNFFGEYPPLYYAVMGLFTGDDIQVSAMAMRVFTIVVFVALLTALYLLLPATRRPTLVLGWLVTTVPLGVFLLASNNPSAWATIGVGTSWIALLGYFETTGRRRIALGALYVLAIVMAAGSRGDGAVYAVFATVLVVLFSFRRRRRFLLEAILPIVMTCVALGFLLASHQAGVGVGGFSGGTASGGGATDQAKELSGAGRLAYNLLNVPLLWSGAFGEWGLGWLDTAVPAVVVFAALGAFLVAAFIGIRRIGWRKAVVVGMTVLVLSALPVYVLQQGGDIVGEQLQPRYLLPLIVLLGGLLALGTPVVEWTRGQLLAVAGGLAVANAVSLHMNIRRYVTGAGKGGLNLDAATEWWWHVPFSPMTVWAVGSLAYACLVFLIAVRMPRPHLEAMARGTRQLP